ncbi:MAG: serine/threonine-protein kinase [Polyangiaceae bacterium]
MSSGKRPNPARVAAIFDTVVELEPDAAARAIEAACGADDELRSEVERLLANDRAAPGDFLAPGAPLAGLELGGDEPQGETARSTRAIKPRDVLPAVLGGEPRATLELSERYVDTGHIGRGGMGEVRALRDQSLKREVAVKTLTPLSAWSRSAVQGFVEEAQITAQLEHPNIVPVHDLGSDRHGTLYFTMKRVQGRTLHELLKDPALQLGSSHRLAVALEVFLKTCDAVAFAHSRGVLHRDIKPANIMVGAFGEVYLMDWGLAKVRPNSGGVEITREPNSPLAIAEESLVGTPCFLAPEMARGELDRVDERSDIFGLGAVLYQIVAGRPPFEGATTAEILEKTATGNVVPPDERGDVLVPKKLARVIMKAMALEPEDRYATASELAGQVREFLHRGMHLPRATFAAGDAIVREGEVGDEAYILTRGKCQVYRSLGAQREVLRTMGPGSLFGEGALLNGAPRLATVEALTDVTVLVLSRDVLEDSFSPDTWEGLLAKTLVERFRELDGRLAALARESEPT